MDECLCRLWNRGGFLLLCPSEHSASHAARILDTMVMVSIFAILGVVGGVLAALLLLAGVLLIMLARIIRAGAPKRRLLTI